MAEATLTIKSSSIEWIPYTAAVSKRGTTTKLCYSNPAKDKLREQVDTMVASGVLPRFVKVTGKRAMTMKIDAYQNDGFWFQQVEPDTDGIIYRLWVEAEEALNAPKLKKTKTKSTTTTKTSKKQRGEQ